jgi:hypothetical protein
MKKIALGFLALLTLTACDSKDWESAGYQDGYAATVNTVCGIRATLVHGKYDNPKYAKGYSKGSNAATLDVRNRGCDSFR